MELNIVFNFRRSPFVILCICRAVSDRTVRRAIAAGAATIEEVGRACRAGTDCGACQTAIAGLIEDADERSCDDCPRRTIQAPYALALEMP
jgi:bacterioferritin-associated ferredoxin